MCLRKIYGLCPPPPCTTLHRILCVNFFYYPHTADKERMRTSTRNGKRRGEEVLAVVRDPGPLGGREGSLVCPTGRRVPRAHRHRLSRRDRVRLETRPFLQQRLSPPQSYPEAHWIRLCAVCHSTGRPGGQART